MNLLPGETLIRSEPAVWVGPRGVHSGRFSLTSRAMIWEGPLPPQRPTDPTGGRGLGPGTGGGVGGPVNDGVLRIALWRCRSASVAPSVEGPTLRLELLSRTLYFRTANQAAWAAAVLQARASAPPPPPGAFAGPGPGVNRAAMPRCEYCGHLSAVTATKCESCGAPF